MTIYTTNSATSKHPIKFPTKTINQYFYFFVSQSLIFSCFFLSLSFGAWIEVCLLSSSPDFNFDASEEDFLVVILVLLFQ